MSLNLLTQKQNKVICYNILFHDALVFWMVNDSIVRSVLFVSSQYFSFNTRHKTTQYNLITLCPRQAAQNKASVFSALPQMWNWNRNADTYCVFWTCPCLNSYWTSILSVLKDITGITFVSEPRITLLGDTSIIKLNKNKLKSIRFALMTGSKCTALHWKDAQPPALVRWTVELATCKNEMIK